VPAFRVPLFRPQFADAHHGAPKNRQGKARYAGHWSARFVRDYVHKRVRA
jgi:hypothetical protein